MEQNNSPRFSYCLIICAIAVIKVSMAIIRFDTASIIAISF